MFNKAMRVTLSLAVMFSIAVGLMPRTDAQELQTITEIVVADDENFSTLEAAVIAAGLDATLADTDADFTVFAPTNAAFDALPEGTLDTLLMPENQEMLVDLLTYHVVEGSAMAADLSDGMRIETLNGKYLDVMINGENVMIEGATVTLTDVMASNGVIHVIDAVMSPMDNIVETAVGTESLSTLVAAVTAAELVGTLSDEGVEYTVFAPSNAAFDALPEGTLDTLLMPENVAQLTDILLFHVVVGNVMSTDLSDGMMVETVQGQELEVSIDGDTVMIGDATVTMADIETSNGVVHMIDTVLIPEVDDTPMLNVYPEGTVYRFFNTNTGDTHFYTSSLATAEVVFNNSLDGGVWEGIFQQEVPTFSAWDYNMDTEMCEADSRPVYRYLNTRTGDTHFYAISDEEVAALEGPFADTFLFEQVEFCAYETEVEGSVPVYRWVNTRVGDTHFYTASESEREFVDSELSEEFQYEGVSFYALPFSN